MKRFSLILAFSLAGILYFLLPYCLFAQKLSAVPVDLEIPIAPTPVKANGRVHLFYELHITN